jgi:hypothetical protein
MTVRNSRDLLQSESGIKSNNTHRVGWCFEQAVSGQVRDSRLSHINGVRLFSELSMAAQGFVDSRAA